VKKPDYKLPATLSEAQREITALRQALTDIDAKAPQASFRSQGWPRDLGGVAGVGIR